MRLIDLASLSRQVAQTRRRTSKVQMLADALKNASPHARILLALFASGALRQQKLGVAAAQLRTLRAVPEAREPTLELLDVDRALDAVSRVRGGGAIAKRLAMLHDLFARATAEERRFLQRLVLGELRQGALEPVVLEALAVAADVPIEDVRRARMLAALEPVVTAAFEAGLEGLKRFDIAPMTPVSPMLAEPSAGPAEALSQLGSAALETKLDGARVQAHKGGGTVRVFARSLNDVTTSVPEVVALVERLPCESVILDGEVIALNGGGRPLPFQETMRRFGRKLDVGTLQRDLPLSTFFFDCLFLDGRSLLDEPTEARAEALRAVVPSEACVERMVTARAEEAEAFLQRARDAGHEGIMAKSLSAPYAAGRRGASWLKIKPAHTLDLVVLAAEWGSGRRTGTLSNLHLGARDPEGGGFVMLGKTFKGLTDTLLRFQTDALLARETHRDEHTVYVRPELVVEIAFNDVQKSPRYPAGLSLRFARVKRYRPDKTAGDADTIAMVRKIHESALAS